MRKIDVHEVIDNARFEFSLSATLNIALPLVMVALTGQFVPGMAVLRASGYRLPASPIIASSALGTALLAPFGCHGLNLAAITAAMCTGREAHEDPRKRYVAGVVGGLCYLVLGIFGATLVSLFSAFPKELIAAQAGLALFAAIAGALAGAMAAGGGFIEDTTATLQARNYYFSRDSSDTVGANQQSKAEEWAQGFILNVKSGYTQGPVGFGVDVIGLLALKLDSSPDRVNTGLLPVQDDGRLTASLNQRGPKLITGSSGLKAAHTKRP